MLAEARVEAVHFLDDAAQVLRLDGEFAHPAGVERRLNPEVKTTRAAILSDLHRVSLRSPTGAIRACHCEEPIGRRGNLAPARSAIDEIASLRS
jgi:hypothetical protein